MFGTKQRKTSDQQDISAPLANLNKAIHKIEDSLAQDTATDNRNAARAKSAVAQNIIGKGTIIDGNVTAEGDLTIEGTIRGDVATKASLMVSPAAIVEGNIIAHHAEVSGRVNGTVQAMGLLVIKASGIIDGDVITKNLNVESGSTFNGRFKVGGQATNQKHDKPIDADKMLPGAK